MSATPPPVEGDQPIPLDELAERCLGDRLRALGEMAGGMAHEFNQPLTIIRTSIENVLIARQRGWNLSPERIDEKLALAMAQCDRLAGLIEHVRTFAREAGGSAQVTMDLPRVVDDALALARSQLTTRGIRLAVECEAGAVAEGNPYAVQECVQALVRNARDAITAAGRGGTITVRCSARPPAIEVADDGPGLSPEARARLFQPFRSTRPPGQGTGLGLVLVRRMIEAMGGRLAIEDRPAGGVVARLSWAGAEGQAP